MVDLETRCAPASASASERRVRSSQSLLALALVAGLAGCGDPPAAPDAAVSDAAVSDAAVSDAAMSDAAVSDGGAATVDSGLPDGGPADAGRADAGPGDAGGDAGPGDAGLADGGLGCDDADGDGVCDDADLCAGFDDGEDADHDETPDGCDCDATECLASKLCRERADGAVCLADEDGDGYEAGVDCDDGDPNVHPGATERCDGVDTDCDPGTGEPDAILRDGIPQGDLAVAIGMGGRVEICGAFPLRRAGLPSLTIPVTVVGLSADAEILAESGRLAFAGGVDATFENLRISAPVTAQLRGIHVILANLVLRDVEIDGLQTAILADRSTVAMTNGRIARSRDRAGVYLDRSTATFTNVVFEDNETRDATRGGGAIFASLGSTLTLDGCTLHDNRNALGVAGAVYLGEAPSQDWGGARLVATSCDWGAGALDNAPDDLVLWYGPGTSGLIVDDVTTDVTCVANSSGNTCAAP